MLAAAYEILLVFELEKGTGQPGWWRLQAKHLLPDESSTVQHIHIVEQLLLESAVDDQVRLLVQCVMVDAYTGVLTCTV